MSISDAPVQSHTEVIDRLGPALEIIAANAERAELEGRAPQENFEALRETGFLRLMAPSQYGGLEATWRTNVEVLARVASACASTAWISAVSLAGQMMVGWLNDEGQADVFGDSPDQFATCVPMGPAARAVRDGDDWILNGRWPFSTGSLNNPWLGQGAVIGEENGMPIFAYFIFPSSEVTHEDDWNATGLSGTGSVTAVAQDVRVPDRRMIPIGDMFAQQFPASQNIGKPLWNTTAAGAIFVGTVGAPIGIARGAMDAFMARMMKGRMITYTHYTDQAKAPVTHLALGEARAKQHAAELMAFDCADFLDAKNASGEPWTLEERGRLRANSALAISLARECVEILFQHSGATGIQRNVYVQRAKRDIDALSVHAALVAQTNYELYGRILTGGDPMTPLV